ncbi:hypothetical protein SLE2022_069270 [Rubroshorea leprosula]
MEAASVRKILAVIILMSMVTLVFSRVPASQHTEEAEKGVDLERGPFQVGIPIYRSIHNPDELVPANEIPTLSTNNVDSRNP